MARLDQAHPLDVEGEWFVDTRCIACDVARHWAPDLIGADDDGLSYVLRQPRSPEEQEQMWRAAEACPTQSIGSRLQRRPTRPPFPHELTPGVWALGHNSAESFGAHAYLARTPSGNVMVDSPRYTRLLTTGVDQLGGITHVLLTHRDDVADADRWAERYGARVWIHADDASAAPYATDVIEGLDPVEVEPGVAAVPIPGHTRGSVAFHVLPGWLFTGDSLHWNRRRRRLDVFPGATWFSWDHLADSMDRLAELAPVEWVLPGHGMWHEVGHDLYERQMADLGPAMRGVGRHGWRAHLAATA